MTNSRMLEQLMESLIHVVGRVAVPEARVLEILGTGWKQVKAFNLADGTRSQNEIAKKANIDQGNFSRTATRWVENGVAFWIGEGKEARLMHIYPVPRKRGAKHAKKRRAGKKGRRN